MKQNLLEMPSACVVITANNEYLTEYAVKAGGTISITLEELLADKVNAKKRKQYRFKRSAMKNAKGFMRDISQLPLRQTLGCTMKGVVKPMANKVFQKLKTVGEVHYE